MQVDRSKSERLQFAALVGAFFFAVALGGQIVAQAGNEIVLMKQNTNPAADAQLYRKLINRVGPVEAQERLLKSGLPFNGPTHLVNHESGNYLFETEGVAGLTKCREYFSGSCYHGFLLHLMGQPREEELIKQVVEHCRKEPGDVIVQCSHAIGHGLLAKHGYKNIPTALSNCERIEVYAPELDLMSCLDGVFMENVFGVHQGGPSPDRWVKPEDLTYPCSDSVFADYLEPCWRNQVALINQFVGNDIPKLESYCRGLSDERIRTTCYSTMAGFVTSISDNESEYKEMCKQFHESWQERCLVLVPEYLFFQGDGIPMIKACAVATSLKDECYWRMFAMVKLRMNKPAVKEGYCRRIKEAKWREECRSSS